MNALEDVKQFHKLFDHPVLETPTIPSAKRVELRINLLQEELKELKIAAEAGDIVEVADALADIQYVLAGAIHEFGLGNLFPKVFAEVQRSNMSKACETIEQAKVTAEFHSEKNGPCRYFSKEVYDFDTKGYKEVYIVVRDSDDKTMKSVGYSPADLSFIKGGL